MKKFFIKICKFFGYEILDQNNFSSPTMGKELNEELSVLNENFSFNENVTCDLSFEDFITLIKTEFSEDLENHNNKLKDFQY